MRRIEKKLYRGPHPGSLLALKVLGVEMIINLEYGVYDLLHADGPVFEYPADLGLTYYHLPCSDWFPPRREFVEKALQLMRMNRCTYLHCFSGVDRTGFVSAAYRMRVQGWRFEDAVAEWKELGRHPWFFWWERELRRYQT